MKLKKKKGWLNSTNITACFEKIVETLHDRALKEIPEVTPVSFRGLAEHVSVDADCFMCNATSLAIISQVVKDGVVKNFSLELHAANFDIGVDVHAPFLYGTKEEIINLLEDRSAFVNRMIEAFNVLEKKFQGEENVLVAC